MSFSESRAICSPVSSDSRRERSKKGRVARPSSSSIRGMGERKCGAETGWCLYLFAILIRRVGFGHHYSFFICLYLN